VIFSIPADHFGSNLKFFERVQGSPELNRLGRDHGVPATFPQLAQEPGPGYQVQPADIQNCEILSVVHVTQQIQVRRKNRLVSQLVMELRHVRYFLAVAEEQNFTRAAKKVGIGQPPLSQQIRALEDELGAPLFHRLSHGAELTSAGKAFLPEARAMMQQAERAKKIAGLGAKGQVGQLRVGFTSSAVFRPIVPHIIREF
jgi:molybdenum-dependent DNA-binding transcriptional regulator ModE